jgi:formylglycine-generating enzyme required for sulfatase activity
LTAAVYIDDERGSRRLEAGDFPLALGGGESAVALPGGSHVGPVAWLGMSDGELFLQVEDVAERIVCNGATLTTSQWLHDGDVIHIGETRIDVRHDADGVRLRVEHEVAENVTEPPSIRPLEPTPHRGGDGEATPISPVEFQPRVLGRAKRRRWRPGWASLLLWAVLIGLGGLAWLVLTARSVAITVRPEPDEMELRGKPFAFEVGGRYLLRPGRYDLTADKQGYHRLDVPVDVTDDPNQSFDFELAKLPGRLQITGPPSGAMVEVDGVEVGVTPLDPLELTAGEHELLIRAERHLDYVTRVSIEGGGVEQSLEVLPTPLWASISFASEPRGATVRVDGEVVGKTPVTAELLEGRHDVELSLDGHKPYGRSLSVEADRPQTLPPVRLDLEDGRLALDSDPTGATVIVDGVYRGQTPLDLRFRPGQVHRIELSKSGHLTETREVRLDPNEKSTLSVALPPREGEVSISARPADAELWVDGEPRGKASQTLRLAAVPHRIEIRKPGFEPYQETVTPRPGFPQSIRVELKTPEQLEAEKFPPLVRSAQGHELVLIEGGRFRMGAPRREPGRRANETERDVELTRRFYLSTKEVTNREFRLFKGGHLSGRAAGFNLEIDHHPAVQPLNTGYRLPTEAEWAWTARHAEGGAPRKYPWGDALPVVPNSGNYADVSARSLLSATLNGYNDGFPATAPVDSFEPNGLGLLNMGGNVAEWTHDVYTIYPSAEVAIDRDPAGPAEGELHVIRGASWMDASVSELRLTYRDYGRDGRPDVGFRIARYAE